MMRGYISDLTFQVPRPRQDYESYLRKASASAVQRNVAASGRKQERNERQRSMLAVTKGQMSAEDWMRTQQGTFTQDKKGMKEERKMLKRAHKQEKRHRKGKDGGKLERRANRDLRKEIKLEDNLLWLVAYPLDMGKRLAAYLPRGGLLGRLARGAPPSPVVPANTDRRGLFGRCFNFRN